MTTLEFTGVVDAFDSLGMYAYVSIGGVNFAREIEETFGEDAKLTVMIAHGGDEQLYKGEFEFYGGFTGTDVTPGDPPEIMIGDADLMDNLYDMDGKIVHLRVDDA
jgi:hypothetical protein